MRARLIHHISEKPDEEKRDAQSKTEEFVNCNLELYFSLCQQISYLIVPEVEPELSCEGGLVATSTSF